MIRFKSPPDKKIHDFSIWYYWYAEKIVANPVILIPVKGGLFFESKCLVSMKEMKAEQLSFTASYVSNYVEDLGTPWILRMDSRFIWWGHESCMIYTQKPLSLISRLIHSSDHCMHRASNLYLINSISTLYRKPTDRLDSGSFCIKAKIYIYPWWSLINHWIDNEWQVKNHTCLCL